MILRRTPVIRQSSGFRRTARARTNPFPDRPRSAQWRNGLVGVRSDVAALARSRAAHGGRRPCRRAPPRGGAAPRRAGRTGRDLGRLPDQARTRTGHLTVGTGRGGARARALRVSDAERDLLFRLAGHSTPGLDVVSSRITPSVQRLLDRLANTPGRRLRRNVDPHGRQRAVRRPDGSDDQAGGESNVTASGDTLSVRAVAPSTPPRSRPTSRPGWSPIYV